VGAIDIDRPVINGVVTGDAVVVGTCSDDVVGALAAAWIGCHADEAKVLRSQLVPLGAEVFVVGADPEIVGVAAGTPHAGVLALPALVVGPNDREPQVLLGQLFPFRLEVVPAHADPQIVSVVAAAPDAHVLLLTALVVNFHIDQA